MARFPSINEQGQFEAPEVQQQIKHLVTNGAGDIRVDTSVGTRVFVGDVMIYGDTGVRAKSVVVAGYPSLHTVYMQRKDDIVTAWFMGNGAIEVGGLHELFDWPIGFRPSAQRVNGQVANAFYVRGLEGNTSFTASGTKAYINIDRLAERFAGYMIFATNDDWPTSLPWSPA